MFYVYLQKHDCILGSTDGQVRTSTTTVGAYGCNGFDSCPHYNSAEVAGKVCLSIDILL